MDLLDGDYNVTAEWYCGTRHRLLQIWIAFPIKRFRSLDFQI
jgi:hypothetical protein